MKLLNVRLKEEEIELIKEKSKKYGFKNTTDYIRLVLLNAELIVVIDNKEDK